MNKKFQNFFFGFGIIVLGIMISQLNFTEVWNGLEKAGYWFLAVIILWGGLYLFNTFTWHIIIKSQGEKQNNPSFFTLYKLTISGFALNYTTPVGLMGGEPYRIMALSPIIGTQRATSSVILFVMTHIFSHFWFWLLSIILYVLLRPMNITMWMITSTAFIFCSLGIWFFISGYKKGIAYRVVNFFRYIPGLKNKVKATIEKHKEKINEIDNQISSLHKQNKKTFITAVLSELLCRIVSALEVYFVLLVIYPSVNYIDCILIIAFTTLLANLLFFIPLQLGGREGGFMLSVKGLAMTVSDGVLVALVVRIRELIWTAIGLLLIKVSSKKKKIT